MYEPPAVSLHRFSQSLLVNELYVKWLTRFKELDKVEK